MPRWFSPCFQDAIFHTLNYLGSGMGLVWWCEVCGMSMSGAICSRIQSMNACRMSNGQWNDAWQEGSCCDVQTLFQAGLLLLFLLQQPSGGHWLSAISMQKKNRAVNKSTMDSLVRRGFMTCFFSDAVAQSSLMLNHSWPRLALGNYLRLEVQ